MTMKRFIITNTLAMMAATASACIWFGTENSYLFSPYDPQEFRDRVENICNDNWQTYLGIKKDYWWFDQEEVTLAARRRGDALMTSYVKHLQQYLDCCNELRQEQWEYPTQQQLAQRRQKLQKVRSYAQGQLRSRLRSQHALLLMRCNMVLGRHRENITFYEQTASKLIETVYRDMMRNIYAGALYHTGRDAEASEIFAEQGDWQSLMTQYYKRRSCQAIEAEYRRNANAAVLPFLLKDFVNNAQEAIDAQQGGEGAVGGKLFIRDIERKEALQMCRLCQRVVSEGRTAVPAMWLSAKAWLEYMFGDRQQSLTDISRATTLDGTPRMKDNARVLQLYIKMALAPRSATLDDYLAQELQWLDGLIGSHGTPANADNAGDDFFSNARDRILHQVLEKKYAADPIRQTAFIKALTTDGYTYCLDTMNVDGVLRYLDYAGSSATNALDRYLKPRQQLDANTVNDLVGTKYLRLGQWQEAMKYLDKVPLTFYNKQGYRVYATRRNWNVEPWLKRQWLSEEEQWGDKQPELKKNVKLLFAREMNTLENGLTVLSGEERLQRCYDLAVRYAQADLAGDCWFLQRNVKSVDDKPFGSDISYAERAKSLLREAALSDVFSRRERALFALSYHYLNDQPWFEEQWSEQRSEFVTVARPAWAQYKALAALADAERQQGNQPADYVSRCDVYRQFLKHYRR